MNLRKLFGIIAIIAMIGLLFAGCSDGGGDGGGGGGGGGPGEPRVVDISSIPGVVPPSTGQIPKKNITETAQYKGTISWSPDVPAFIEAEVYTATITLNVKSGFTFDGVKEDFFTVAGAESVHNNANSGVITAVFPPAAFGVIFDPDNGEDFIFKNVQPGELVTAPDGVKKRIEAIDINSLKTAGLYERQLELLGWYKDGVKFNFDTPITESTVLKAKWSDIPSPISSVPANSVAEAVTYIKANPEEYLLLLSADVSCSSQTLNTTGIKLMIAGVGGERKINLTSNGALFTVGSYSATGVEMTLGNNITLVGKTIGVNGATSSNNNNLIAVQSGGSFIMLPGSKITGNTSTSTSTGYDAAVRITGSGSTFLMQGGVISGNTGVNGNADVYIDNNVAFGFKLSGSAQIGTLTLNATSTAYAFPTIVSGWTGSVGKLNLRAISNSMDTIMSYWQEKIIIEADGGYVLSVSDLAKFKLGDFISTASIDNVVPISNTHYLANSGWLLKNGTGLNVLLSKNNGPAKDYIYLNQALNAITEPGNYTVTIKTDFELAPRKLETSNIKITLIGADTERKISLSQNGVLFSVGAYQTTGIELILGNNITLVGRTNGVNGATADNNNNLIVVQYGASFTMLQGSKITGNTYFSSFSSNNGDGAAVYVKDTGSFFSMQGGTVSGNKGYKGESRNADVYINYSSASALSLSGSAQIDSLILYADDSTRSSVIIASNWTGKINELNLAGNITSKDSTISYWLYEEVLKEAKGHVISSSDIEKITLGSFWYGFPPYVTPISDTHHLYYTGQLFPNGQEHTVLHSINNGRYLAYPDLTTALYYIGSGDNIVTIVTDQGVESPNGGNRDGRKIDKSGANVTFNSADNNEKIITLTNTNGYMFTISGSDVALTLGNNITLVGSSTMPIYDSGVVEVKNGATLTMLYGSKITGHTTYNSGAAVYVDQSTLIMNGGEIIGNTNTSKGESNSNTRTPTGGLRIYSSKLFMKKGKIIGNTNGNGDAADIYNGGSEIILSGEAQIGSVIATSTSLITVASSLINDFKLSFYYNGSNDLVGKKILGSSSGYTFTETDISKVQLNLWIGNDGAPTPINQHEINIEGLLVAK